MKVCESSAITEGVMALYIKAWVQSHPRHTVQCKAQSERLGFALETPMIIMIINTIIVCQSSTPLTSPFHPDPHRVVEITSIDVKLTDFS